MRTERKIFHSPARDLGTANLRHLEAFLAIQGDVLHVVHHTRSSDDVGGGGIGSAPVWIDWHVSSLILMCIYVFASVNA